MGKIWEELSRKKQKNKVIVPKYECAKVAIAEMWHTEDSY